MALAVFRLPRRLRCAMLFALVTIIVAGCATAQPPSTPALTGAPPPPAIAASQPAPVVVSENVVYAFAPGKIVIIEPQSATVVKEITNGLANVEWADPVVTPDNRLLFVNDRAGAQVIVLDTEQQQIVRRIDVGPRPVHIYNPLKGKEIWTHSDEEGAFYVIHSERLEVIAKVVAALQGTGHGKLLYHPSLGNKAYATNTNDPAAFVIDLDKKQTIGVIELCKADDGQGGTHGKAYSPHSRHAYFECSRTGKTAVVDTTTDALIKDLEGSGQIFTSPDERVAVVVDKRNGRFRLIDTTQGSIEVAAVAAQGGPDKLEFVDSGGKLYGIAANTLTPDVTVIDFQNMVVAKRIAAGDIARPEGAQFFHRGGTVGGGFYFTPASGDGLVAIVDSTRLILHGTVRVEGVGGVAFVGARRR